MAPKADSDLRPHQRFFFSDGSLYLSVEDCLYSVHKSLFEIHASKFPWHEFETCFNKPYTLEGIKTIDFDRLLAYLYPRHLWVDEAETTEEWVSILRLASKWGFETLRSRAISKLERTVASPVDMIVLGRHYDFPDIVLHGIATLCQSTTPLSSEEGHRLGVDDVVNVYRIRHELYGSAITTVSFEKALEKVRITLSNGEHQDEQGLEGGEADHGLNDKQSREAVSLTGVTDGSEGHVIGSLDANPASQTSAEKDEETAASASNTLAGVERSEDRSDPVSEQERTDANIISPSSETLLGASPGTETQANPEYAKERLNELSPGDKPTLNTSSGGSPTTTFSDLTEPPEFSGQVIQVIRFLDELTANNFEPFTRSILEWFKAIPDSQTLYQIARLIVERAVEQPGQFDILVRLCREMVKRLSGKVQIKGPKGKITSGGHLFRDYLGDIVRDHLKGVTASARAASECVDGVRRQRLIEFIGELTNSTGLDVWTPDIVDKWVTALLDIHDEEKITTLCTLMTRAGPLWDNSSRKLSARMTSWMERMSNVAQRTSNPRIRTLLQDVIKLRKFSWVAN